MKFMALLLMCFGLPILAARAEDIGNPSNAAPFGLKWGMAVADAKAMGVKLTNTDEKKTFGLSYGATELPKMLPDAVFVAISFGFQDKLWRIVVIGQDVTSDPYGSGVKTRYAELVAALTEKYGRGNPHEYQDSEVWTRPEEFLTGISTGRSWYYTDFDSENVFVQIGIQAHGADTGYWRIIYELKSLRALFQADQKAHEKDAL